MSGEKTIWEEIKIFCGFTIYALLYAVGAVTTLSIALLLVLKIDIAEWKYLSHIFFFIWGGCTIGFYLHYYHQDKQTFKQPEPRPQLPKIKEGENLLDYFHRVNEKDTK